jgi:putative hemolysin
MKSNQIRTVKQNDIKVLKTKNYFNLGPILGTQEFKELAKLNFTGGKIISSSILRVLKFHKLNKIYSGYNGLGGLHFVRYVISQLKLEFEVNEESLSNIPLDGAFVTVSNHPFGGADGIGVFNSILPIRSDFKALGNYMLSRLEPLSENLISVDPFINNGKAMMNISGLKKAMQHLNDGHPLGIFPAGEVSSYNNDYPGICDKKWDVSVMRIIQKANVPVVPIYFHGTNSKLFHLLGKITPLLRTVKIPSELLNKKEYKIKISIGKPIDLQTQTNYKSIEGYSEFIRNETYALANLELKKKPTRILDLTNRIPKEVEPIAQPVDSKNTLKEIQALRKDNLLLKKGEYDLFCAEYNKIPLLIHEIGRQREITFREVGEGSNKCLDLDAYDKFYQHLIIWDSKKNMLVGAYRIGKGKELLQQFGPDGFYTASLFNYKPDFSSILEESIELGRSFITKAYQRKAIPLYLLWAGIFKFVTQNPWCKYLLGPVSISNELEKIEKDRIVTHINKYYRQRELKKYVSCKNGFKVDRDYKFKQDNPCFQDLKLPILFKKYLQINGKIIEFNVDPLFNNTLDGLLFLKFSDIPESFVNRFSLINS